MGDQDLTQRVGQLVAGGACGQQLLGIEGVALRPAVDPLDEVEARLGAKYAGQLGRQLIAVKARQFEPLHATRPLEFGEHTQQGVSAVQLVAAICGEYQAPALPEGADEIGQQIQRGPVRPVEILDDQHERTLGGEPREEARAKLEEATLGRAAGPVERLRRLAQGGHEANELRPAGPEELLERRRRELRGEAPQRLHEWRERECALGELDTSSRQRAESVRAGRPDARLNEPGLSDTGLAGDQDGRRAALQGRSERGAHAVEFCLAADEDRARDPVGHGLNYVRHESPFHWCARRTLPIVVFDARRYPTNSQVGRI
ncbi:MAG: hypothetical protein ABSG37_05570 [Candidatus Limnocylindrales bacterium]